MRKEVRSSVRFFPSLSRYPKIPGYPHIFVLDESGRLLHSQDTLPLEDRATYKEVAFLEFLTAWRPES